MNTKQCIYRNCGNTTTTMPNLTYFSFPQKDQSKASTWAELAGCDGINLKNKFLCEEHFNPIYISKTPRRMVLLPNAVPYAYNDHSQSKNEDSFEEDFNGTNLKLKDALDISLMEEYDDKDIAENGDNIIYGTESDDLIEQNDELSSTKYTDPLITENDDDHHEDHIDDQQFEQKIDTVVARRKYDKPPNQSNFSTVSSGSHVTKRQKVQNSTDHSTISQKSAEVESVNSSKDSRSTSMKTSLKIHDEGPLCIDYTENNSDITTFIYKGEEYIQMPKRIYVQQRAKLDAEIFESRKKMQQITQIISG